VPDPVRCRFDEATGLSSRAVELSDVRGTLQAWTLPEVEGVLAEAEAATRQGWTAAGFVAYDAAPAFDAALSVPSGQAPSAGVGAGVDLPLAWFGLFAHSHPAEPLPRVVSFPTGPRGRPGPSGSHLGTPDGARSGGPLWACEIGSEEHGRAVGAIREAIAAGDTYLTNYTTRFRRPWLPTDDPFSLYQRLVSGHSSGLHAYIETEDWVVASGSPELFFDLRSDRLTARPMKGTAPRGRWSDEDRRVAEELRTSPKERAENLMVVDLVRNDLGRVAVPGTVEVPGFCRIERHPTVWQLTSTVTATARPGTGLTDVFAALFPCASVTGAPKVATMRIISALEPSARGVYCGAIGFLRRVETTTPEPGGLEARFSVAIRTAVVHKRRQLVEYGSGGGITWDSTSAAEWDETLVKTRVLAEGSAAGPPPPALLETMRFDPSMASGETGGIRNLHRHIDRMTASAAYFGYRRPADLCQRLLGAVARSGPARVRLLLHCDGTVDIELHPLAGEASSAAHPCELCIDDLTVDPSDAGLFHKTTDRRRYDESNARHPRADDVIFVNDRGEVTETTRANLAVRIGRRWFTPPLECGLLPGIERGRLVECGTLTERVITVHELRAADAVATVSSLRGWRPATVRPRCPC
jgi:para-aminobenzoate synthetase / 4-amino-4-deoxychorismate lyase